MIDKLTSTLSWLYLQYTFITGIYLLDRAEIYIFNLFTLGKISSFYLFYIGLVSSATKKLRNTKVSKFKKPFVP